MSRRFDAAVAWRRRRLRHYDQRDTSKCEFCEHRIPPPSIQLSSRSNRTPGRRWKKQESRAACQRTTKHFAMLFDLEVGKEVLAADFVLSSRSRETIRPIERELERQLEIRNRLTQELTILSGRELLKIVDQLLKEQTHELRQLD